ncbi:MAG: DUF3488 domain-containing protein [Gammaproteobacteria bacterium HGW-Gammaproteobacteria-3]|nr:MAG: DUF3488 domain-containing protein [Gammaproteobacteria bacterium HGW-Gammaproteobacteria-3]
MVTEISKNNLIFLLSAIGLIALPHVKHIAPTVFAFFCLMLTWRFAGVWRPRWLPNKALLFVLTLAGIFLLYSQHQGILGRDAGTRLFMTALALKLLEIKQQRDLYLIVYLTFIVAASQFLYEQNIFMAVYILLTCGVLLATLISLNNTKQDNVLALKTAGVIIVQALPIAIALFMLFPRVEAPRWMVFKDPHQARSGLGDSMEPGSISRLGLSDERVFRVKFAGALPPKNQRYWRGPVLAYTDGKHWKQTQSRFADARRDKIKAQGRAYQYTIMLEPQDKNWVFALDMPTHFADDLSMNANYQLTTHKDPNRRTEYRMTSRLDYNTGEITPDEYRENLQLPKAPIDKIIALVQRLKGFDTAPETFIQALMQHFRQEDFHYTLMPPLMEDKPIETFLFEKRLGFCGHYASAFVYLMRVAHIPARVVTGYQGGEFNQVGKFLEIRQAHAHAWAEVWLQNRGWVRIDPTTAIAPERVEQNVDIEQQIASGAVSFIESDAAQALSWLGDVRQLWGSLDYSWQRWVINYNSANQARFLSSFGIETLRQMLYWLMAIVAFITALLSWLLLRGKNNNTDKVLIVYQRFCRKLGKIGLRRKPGEGAVDFACRIKRACPEHAPAVDVITGLFVKLRYGRHPTQNDWLKLKKQVALFKP